jgi:hypothetical protein
LGKRSVARFPVIRNLVRFGRKLSVTRVERMRKKAKFEKKKVYEIWKNKEGKKKLQD